MIFYFSGTGNTKWAAKQLAIATGEKLCYIPDEMEREPCEYTLQENERLGFCFPTHGWQPPRIVRNFIEKAVFHSVSYVYALTTCGDNIGYTMRILNKELNKKRLHANATFAVIMPESNVCFPFLHLDTHERELQKKQAAKERIRHICKIVVNRQCIEDLVKGAIPYTYTYVIGGFYNKHLITDKHFWVDKEKCIQCGLCAKLCPTKDIDNIPPHWKHDGSCTNCLACYHHCPSHAIHWGKIKRGQYVFKE